MRVGMHHVLRPGVHCCIFSGPQGGQVQTNLLQLPKLCGSKPTHGTLLSCTQCTQCTAHLDGISMLVLQHTLDAGHQDGVNHQPAPQHTPPAHAGAAHAGSHAGRQAARQVWLAPGVPSTAQVHAMQQQHPSVFSAASGVAISRLPVRMALRGLFSITLYCRVQAGTGGPVGQQRGGQAVTT